MRLLRAILVVTALGATAGAFVGLVAMFALQLRFVSNVKALQLDWSLFGYAAAFGAAFGLVLGPMLGFGLLRHVPLWRALLGTGIGALLGVAAAFLLHVHLFIAPVVGMLLAAIVLRLMARPRAATHASPPSGPVA